MSKKDRLLLKSDWFKEVSWEILNKLKEVLDLTREIKEEVKTFQSQY